MAKKNTTGGTLKQGRSTSAKGGSLKSSRSTKNGKMLVVAPMSSGWAVKREGSTRSRTYDTQAEAVKAAAKTARDSRSDVVIHRKDGSIREKVSTSKADLQMLDIWRSTHQSKSHTKRH